MVRPFSYGTSLFVKHPLVTANNVHVALINAQNYARYAVQLSGTTPDVTANIYANGCQTVVALSGSTYVNTAADGLTPVWSNSGVVQSAAKKSLTAAQIKALNTTPQALVPAQGAGKIIVPISIQGRLTFGTAAYATNTTLNIGFASGSDPLFSNTTLLPVTAGAPIQPFFAIAQSGVTGNDNEYIANAALNLSVPTANPATGDGLLDVYVTYLVVTL